MILLSRWLLSSATVFLLAVSGFGATIALQNPGPSIQQTTSSPCILGEPTCSNPATFPYNITPTNTNYVAISPSYTVGQLRSVVGDTFSVGIDVNSTTSPLATEILNSFTLAIGGVPQFTYTGPTQLAVTNGGAGFSDDVLTGFDLTGLAGNLSAGFTVSIANATAGREQFFLIAAPASPSAVPEPSSILLFGTALLGGFGLWQRRRRAIC